MLGIHRQYGGEFMTALFNFSEEPVTIADPASGAKDLLSGKRVLCKELKLEGYGFFWLLEKAGGADGQ